MSSHRRLRYGGSVAAACRNQGGNRMELAAIIVILVTCSILVGMVLGAAAEELRKVDRTIDLRERLEPFDDVTIDLRPPAFPSVTPRARTR